MSRTHEFTAGDLGGGYGWKIEENVHFHRLVNSPVCPCHHALIISRETGTLKWTQPRIVVGTGDRGDDEATLICLDCILEAAAKLETRDE